MNSRPVIRGELRENGHEVELLPRGFLGPGLFDLYLATAGKTSRFDRKNKCQVCPIGRWAEARADLVGAGFYVLEEYRLQKHSQAEAARRHRAIEDFPRVLEAMQKIRPFFGYQILGARFLHEHPRALLADEQGCGKTVQTLAALPCDAAAIVVCPAVARNVWVAECAHLRPDLKPRRLTDDTFPSPAPGEVLVVGYEDVVRRLLTRPACALGGKVKVALDEATPVPCPQGDGVLCTHNTRVGGLLCLKGLPMASFRMLACDHPEPVVPACTHLITDEAHYLKNKKSQRAKAHAKLEARARVGWHLTGTPLPNTPDELYQVLDSIGLAREAFGSWEMFVELFGGRFVEIRIKGGKKRKIVEWPDLRAVDQASFGKLSDGVRSLLSRVMLRRTKSEVLKDLPPKRYQWIDVDVDVEVEKECDEVERSIRRTLGLPIQEVEDQQMIPLHEIAPLREKLARAKTPAAVELCEQYEATGTPLIVFSAHVYPIDVIGKRKGWAKIDGTTSDKKRFAIVEAFQKGELLGVACTIKAAGTALTLTRAHDLLEIDLDWVPANNAQAEGRCHRIGTTEPVVITRLRCAHPMDSHVLEVLAKKTKVIEAAMST